MQKIHFCSYLGKEGQRRHFILFLQIFNFCFYNTELLIPNSMSSKILSQMSSHPKWVIVQNNLGRSDCERFLKVWYLKNHHRDKNDFLVSQKSTGLVLTWLSLARLVQNYTSEIYSKYNYGQLSFAC